MLFDRVFLATLIIGVWALIRFVEELLPDRVFYYLTKPFPLYAVMLYVFIMAIHTIWIAIMQKRKGYLNTKFENDYDAVPQLSKYPTIDIFVPIYNEDKVIAKTVDNLLEINYPSFKIYLLNDHSSDDTQKIIAEYESRYPEKVKAVDLSGERKRGKSAALNYAAKRSDGELIAVFDADARVEKEILLKMVPYLDDSSTAAVQCQKRISNYSANRLTKLQENEFCMDIYFQCAKDAIGGNAELRGNGQLVKRKLLEVVGLWDEETLTDDLELSTRFLVNGFKIRFCREAKVFEQAPMTFEALLKQRLRWCEGSLRRLLSNLFRMFGPGMQPTFAQQFDSLVFLSQFAVPLWFFLDFITQGFNFILGKETYLTTIMLISFAISLITWINATLGIRIYRKLSWRTSMIRAVETNWYFLSLWPTVVLLTIRKVLFSRTRGKWHRTEHFSEVELKKV